MVKEKKSTDFMAYFKTSLSLKIWLVKKIKIKIKTESQQWFSFLV